MHVCTLDKQINTPSCPLPLENVCVCVKDTDCQEIYDIFMARNQSLIRKVKHNYQFCGTEGGSPKYCCPYSNDMTCPEAERSCFDGTQCIEEHQVCDGNLDCSDESDEAICFGCHTGGLTLGQFVCDSKPDCSDGSDEDDCFICENGDLKRNEWVCDGVNDCSDGSDEDDCFVCENGDLTRNQWVCDNVIDCVDESDEAFCFTCRDGEVHRDDFNNVKCNDWAICSDGSDEENCVEECQADEFKCLNGEKCVHIDGICNGIKDCFDGSDEENCGCCQGSSYHICWIWGSLPA